MQHIMATPVPVLVADNSWSTFVHSFTLYDVVNTLVTLGALTFAFYMFYSFSKYGKYGRDVSRESQEQDRLNHEENVFIHPEILHDNLGPANTVNTLNASKKDLPVKPDVPKPKTNPQVRHPSAKKDSIKKVGDK